MTTPDPVEPWYPKLPVTPDPVVGIVEGLTTCLCLAAEAAGAPLCMCCPVHTDRPPAADGCSCQCTKIGPDGRPVAGKGLGWVRTVNEELIPGPTGAGRPRAGCRPPGKWRVTVEIGILRCIVSANQAQPPTCDQRRQDHARAKADEWLLRWLVQCCPALQGIGLFSARIVPLGPSGGCAGSIMQIVFDM